MNQSFRFIGAPTQATFESAEKRWGRAQMASTWPVSGQVARHEGAEHVAANSTFGSPHTQSPPGWSFEQGERLRSLAQAQGLLPEHLAHLSALSMDQVQELLNSRAEGLASCFYSAQIKRHAGNKLLDRLGATGEST
jgi:hypothetical protein